MRKRDIIIPIVIGEAVALIYFGVSKYLELPKILVRFGNYFPVLLPLLSALGIIAAYFIAKKIPVVFQVAKCLLVGILNTFVDLGILNILMFVFNTFAGFWASVFKAFSFACSVAHSYFWNKFWTFEKKETNVNPREMGQFFLVAGVGFFLNVGIFSFLVNIVGRRFGLSADIWANLSAIIATTIVFTWNFLGYKLVVFKK